MADMTNNKIDMSVEAFNMAKSIGFGSDESKFKEWEKELIRKIYEVIGLSDIPDEFLTFSKFVDSFSGILVKSVQADVAIMNLTKRLAMFRLSESIQSTADKPVADGPAPVETKEEAKPGFDPLAK